MTCKQGNMSASHIHCGRRYEAATMTYTQVFETLQVACKQRISSQQYMYVSSVPHGQIVN